MQVNEAWKQGLIKEGAKVLEYDGIEFPKGECIIGEVDAIGFYLWQNKMDGSRGRRSPSERGFTYSWSVGRWNSNFITLASTPTKGEKFKVGDTVVGNKQANKYGSTREGWEGKVTEIGDNYFEAEALSDGSVFGGLNYGYFDLKLNKKGEEAMADVGKRVWQVLIVNKKEDKILVNETVIGGADKDAFRLSVAEDHAKELKGVAEDCLIDVREVAGYTKE